MARTYKAPPKQKGTRQRVPRASQTKPVVDSQEAGAADNRSGPLTWYYCGKCRKPTDIEVMWVDSDGMYFCKGCK